MLALRKQFERTDAFYGMPFHELVHWTGHEDRLKRKFGSSNGSSDYDFEELVAELGAAFLCSSTGINSTITNSVAYLKNDKRFIFRASAKAQKAAGYLQASAKVCSSF